MDLLVQTATVWVLFGALLFLPLVGAPRALRHTAVVLLCLELVVLMFWSYGDSSFAHRVATVDIPLLALGVLAGGAVHGLRRRQA